MEKFITVFTPTYNRAYTIEKLYKSLCLQTNKNFIWFIVDDGSTDDTFKAVDSFIKENEIEIKYIYKENGGKMSAHNVGVKNTSTEYFLCVDSDDYLEENSIQKIYLNLKNIQKDDVAGIVAYRGNNLKKTLKNKEFPFINQYSTLSNLYKFGFEGDTTLIFKTQIIKKFLFPEIPGEKFITEAYIYDQIDLNYKYYVLNEIFIICEYLEDGYTRNTNNLYKNNPIGWSLYYRQRGNNSKNIKEKIYYFSHYIAFCKLAKQKKIIKNSGSQFFTISSYIMGIYLYKKYKRLFDK